MMRVGTFSLLAGMAVAGCRGGESDLPPVHLIHNMDTQLRGKAYRRDTTGVFNDGGVWQHPVEGTIARGELDEDDEFYRGLDAKGKPLQLFPTAIKTGGIDGGIPEALADRGVSRYHIYCAPCHGALGDGMSALNQPALDGGQRLTIPAPSFFDPRRKGLLAGEMFAAITNGVNNGNMASHSAQVPPYDRWAIIAHIRRDIQKQGYEGGEVLGEVNIKVASKEAGALLYKVKGCNACHSLDGSKLMGPTWKGVFGESVETSAGTVTVDEAYIRESTLNPQAKIVTGYPPAMPVTPMSEVELKSIVMLIESLK